MAFDQLIEGIENVSGQCVSLIGTEQHAEIGALQAELESLRAQLKERDEYIALIERSNREATAAVSLIEDTIGTLVKGFRSKLSENERSDQDFAQEIENEEDIPSKIVKLFDLVENTSVHRIKRTVKLLSSTLQGHIEFLNRLAANPDLQSLFLVSSNSGRTFLPEAARQLIVAQAARTSQFLAECEKEDRYNSPFGSIGEILDLEIDHHRRFDEIVDVVEGGQLDEGELRILLLQEVTLTSALRRYAGSLMRRLVGEKQEKTESLGYFEKAFSHLSKWDEESGEFSPAALCELAKRLSREVRHRRREVVSGKGSESWNWVNWGRRLYCSLTGIDGESVDLSDVRIAIEEAAFTGVGVGFRRDGR
jgi:hypothetical protein